jgi:hypothetical protein
MEIGREMSIVIEEDESVDADGQTSLMLKSDQLGSDIEIMPLDDSYTEVCCLHASISFAASENVFFQNTWNIVMVYYRRSFCLHLPMQLLNEPSRIKARLEHTVNDGQVSAVYV